jgi:hypothetical protein
VKTATRVALAGLSLLLPSQALAVDWSLSGSLSESVEANNNLFMRSMLAGGTLASYSTVSTSALMRTPTSELTINSNVNYTKYWGGTEGIQSEALSEGVAGHYVTKEKNFGDQEYLDLGWRRSNTQVAILGDLGVSVPVKGSIDTYTIGGGIDRTISLLDTVSLSARSVFTNYDPAQAGVAFSDSTATGTWRHRLTSTVSLLANSSFEWLSYDNATNSTTMLVRETVGVDAQLSALLSFRGNAGFVYVKSNNAFSPITTAVPGITQPTSGSGTGFITDMVLTYRVLKNTTLTLSGAQSVSPSVVGSLVKLTTLHAGLSQNINSLSTLSFAADASRQATSSGSSDFLSGTVSYSYQLAREWMLQLSYRYLHRSAVTGSPTNLAFDPVTGLPISTFSGLGPASSNSVMAVISKSFTILPLGR